MSTDQLSATFAALADPTRRAILTHLAQGEATVTEIAAPFEISLPAISKHLKVLERAGLISRSREAQWRPCRLEAEPLKQATDWLEHYRQFWGESFDRLDEYEALVTVTFVEQSGKTQMTFHHAIFETVEGHDAHQGGWSESFDRLADYLAKSDRKIPIVAQE
ncbi:MAG: metalloregulator ArsR/SmtB family transcription factor [Synechococcales bacterium]|nr:metalloregulator ArsR/SmtB family transcription factor [Synechococcales bacterium]